MLGVRFTTPIRSTTPNRTTINLCDGPLLDLAAVAAGESASIIIGIVWPAQPKGDGNGQEATTITNCKDRALFFPAAVFPHFHHTGKTFHHTSKRDPFPSCKIVIFLLCEPLAISVELCFGGRRQGRTKWTQGAEAISG